MTDTIWLHKKKSWVRDVASCDDDVAIVREDGGNIQNEDQSKENRTRPIENWTVFLDKSNEETENNFAQEYTKSKLENDPITEKKFPFKGQKEENIDLVPDDTTGKNESVTRTKKETTVLLDRQIDNMIFIGYQIPRPQKGLFVDDL